VIRHITREAACQAVAVWLLQLGARELSPAIEIAEIEICWLWYTCCREVSGMRVVCSLVIALPWP